MECVDWNLLFRIFQQERVQMEKKKKSLHSYFRMFYGNVDDLKLCHEKIIFGRLSKTHRYQ